MAVILFCILFCGGASVYVPPKEILKTKSPGPLITESHIICSDRIKLFAVNKIIETSKTPIIIGIHGLGGHAGVFNDFTSFAVNNGLSFLTKIHQVDRLRFFYPHYMHSFCGLHPR